MRPTPNLSTIEFVLLLALMTSILALSIDGMLPALHIIGDDLNVQNPNDTQLVISSMFLGFAIGQLLAGPLSDSFGRKPIIYLGYVFFLVGCLLSIFAENFTTMLIGRVLQGLGAAAPRIIGMALTRDLYKGREMARIMSFIMILFILVPAMAPSLGQLILNVASWRMIFVLFLASAAIAFVWFAFRLPETLSKDNRYTLSPTNIKNSMVEVFSHRTFIGYTLSAGIIFGAFLGYLNSAQQIFQTTYGTGKWFSIYFGIATLPIGLAAYFNAKLVMKLGMRYLCIRALIALTAISFLMLGWILISGKSPEFILFMIWIIPAFFCMGILFGNFNALAMEPVGNVAGMGAALLGSISTFISLPLGWAIGASYDGTILPIMIGFALLGSAAIAVVQMTETASGN